MDRWFARALLLAILGCAWPAGTADVQSEYWPGESFADYRSYAWLPSDAHRRERTQAEDHRVHDLVRAAIDERLAANGFVRTSGAAAQFLVTYHCSLTRELGVELIDQVWYGGGDALAWKNARGRVEIGRIEQGSIVIDIVKSSSGRRVWRGIARGRVSLGAPPEELGPVVDRAVRQILDQFPPGEQGSGIRGTDSARMGRSGDAVTEIAPVDLRVLSCSRRARSKL